MKTKLSMYALATIGLLLGFSSCEESEPTPENPINKEEIEITGEITGEENWSKDNTYLLKGFVYITEGAELSIEEGTVIKGDKATKASLIIERGGKIWAKGTANEPIVFTSNQPKGERNYGDWGGIILCGKASVNTATGEGKIEGGPRSFYGGGTTPNDNDNSGALEYVRIEYPGIEYQTDNEINGLTLGGVGNGTSIHHVQVSFSGDDSFEWFGGTVNAKNLVTFCGWDDEFDTDYGYRGKIQFAVGLCNPEVADKSKSNGFESDNDGSGSSNTPNTQAIFSNVSLFGPYQTKTNITEPSQGNGAFQSSMHLRRNTQLNSYNSIYAGWPVGLIIENGGKGDAQGNAESGSLKLANNILAGMLENFKDATSKGDIAGWTEEYWGQADLNNTSMDETSDLQLQDPFNINQPNFTAKSGSPVLNAADFNYSKLQDAFFEEVEFVGAFGTTNWTSGWCEFDPQNADY